MVDISTGQAGAEALRRRYKRKPYRPIDRERFREMRLIQGLSIEGAAKLLGVTPRTVWTLVQAGTLPAVRFGRSVRIDPADLRRFIDRAKSATQGVGHG